MTQKKFEKVCQEIRAVNKFIKEANEKRYYFNMAYATGADKFFRVDDLKPFYLTGLYAYEKDGMKAIEVILAPMSSLNEGGSRLILSFGDTVVSEWYKDKNIQFLLSVLNKDTEDSNGINSFSGGRIMDFRDNLYYVFLEGLMKAEAKVSGCKSVVDYDSNKYRDLMSLAIDGAVKLDLKNNTCAEKGVEDKIQNNNTEEKEMNNLEKLGQDQRMMEALGAVIGGMVKGQGKLHIKGTLSIKVDIDAERSREKNGERKLAETMKVKGGIELGLDVELEGSVSGEASGNANVGTDVNKE